MAAAAAPGRASRTGNRVHNSAARGSGRVVPLALVLAVASISLGGCGNMLEKISEVGKPPAFDPIENPNAQPTYTPVTMPMPAPLTDVRQANSLWRQGSRTFFADQRASKVGDILTVVITIDDSAKLANKTSQSRDGANNADLTALLGYQAGLHNIFGKNVDPTNLVNSTSTTAQTGDGTVDRSEAVDLRVAVVITQVPAERQHGPERHAAGARQHRAARAGRAGYHPAGGRLDRERDYLRPDRRGPDRLWRPRHDQRRPATPLRPAGLRHPVPVLSTFYLERLTSGRGGVSAAAFLF